MNREATIAFLMMGQVILIDNVEPPGMVEYKDEEPETDVRPEPLRKGRTTARGGNSNDWKGRRFG